MNDSVWIKSGRRPRARRGSGECIHKNKYAREFSVPAKVTYEKALEIYSKKSLSPGR